jgi:hypothetical protein
VADESPNHPQPQLRLVSVVIHSRIWEFNCRWAVPTIRLDQPTDEPFAFSKQFHCVLKGPIRKVWVACYTQSQDKEVAHRLGANDVAQPDWQEEALIRIYVRDITRFNARHKANETLFLENRMIRNAPLECRRYITSIIPKLD